MVQDNLSTPPIGLAEIACLLGSRVDIGSVCTSENINMWSKFKPIRSMTFGFDSFEEFAAECKKHNYGLKAPWKGNPQAVIDSWDGELNGWEYDRPTERSLHRLTDFMRYNHKAVPPIGDVYCDPRASINGSGGGSIDENGDITTGGAIIRAGFSSELGDDEKSLMKIGDIIDKPEVYFGFIGVLPNRPNYLIQSGAQPITEENSTADFEIRALSVGTYRFYPVMFDSPQTGDAVMAGNICAVPNVDYVTCVVSQGVNGEILPEIGGGFRIDFWVSVVDDNTLKYHLDIFTEKFDAQINDLYIFLRKDAGDSGQAGEYTKKLFSSRYIGPDNHYIVEETVSGLSTDTVYGGVRYIRFFYGTKQIDPIYAAEQPMDL